MITVYSQENPELLKTPLILEGNKLLVGYNKEQIRIFLPKIYRRKP
jgi:regulatory protein spx